MSDLTIYTKIDPTEFSFEGLSINDITTGIKKLSNQANYITGKALEYVQENKLYKEAGYKKFSDYVENEFGMKKRNAYQLIDFANTYDVLRLSYEKVRNRAQNDEIQKVNDRAQNDEVEKVRNRAQNCTDKKVDDCSRNEAAEKVRNRAQNGVAEKVNDCSQNGTDKKVRNRAQNDEVEKVRNRAQILPTSEWQTRPLKALPDDKKVEVWIELTKDGKIPTGKQVAEKVKSIIGGKKSSSGTEVKQTDKKDKPKKVKDNKPIVNEPFTPYKARVKELESQLEALKSIRRTNAEQMDRIIELEEELEKANKALAEKVKMNNDLLAQMLSYSQGESSIDTSALEARIIELESENKKLQAAVDECADSITPDEEFVKTLQYQIKASGEELTKQKKLNATLQSQLNAFKTYSKEDKDLMVKLGELESALDKCDKKRARLEQSNMKAAQAVAEHSELKEKHFKLELMFNNVLKFLNALGFTVKTDYDNGSIEFYDEDGDMLSIDE